MGTQQPVVLQNLTAGLAVQINAEGHSRRIDYAGDESASPLIAPIPRAWQP
jgi:hypothetical protein